jgi:hypothetical protein
MREPALVRVLGEHVAILHFEGFADSVRHGEEDYLTAVSRWGFIQPQMNGIDADGKR